MKAVVCCPFVFCLKQACGILGKRKILPQTGDENHKYITKNIVSGTHKSKLDVELLLRNSCQAELHGSSCPK